MKITLFSRNKAFKFILIALAFFVIFSTSLFLNEAKDKAYAESFYWSDEEVRADDFGVPIDLDNKIITVSSAEELGLFMYLNENSMLSSNNDWTLNFSSDLDLNEYYIRPIKLGSNWTINGCGHLIYNINLQMDYDGNPIGFFSECENSVIRNLVVKGRFEIDGNYSDDIIIGGLVGAVKGTLIENTGTNISISSTNIGDNCIIGGICGKASGIMENSYQNGTIKTDSDSAISGSLIGYNDIANCRSLYSGNVSLNFFGNMPDPTTSQVASKLSASSMKASPGKKGLVDLLNKNTGKTHNERYCWKISDGNDGLPVFSVPYESFEIQLISGSNGEFKSNPEKISYTPIDADAPVLPEPVPYDGYRFSRWVLCESDGNWESGSIFNWVPGNFGNITLIAEWVSRSDVLFKTEYYFENYNGIFVKNERLTHNSYGITDSEAQAVILSGENAVVGYVLDEENENNVTLGVVNGNGSTVFKLYYKLIRYEIRFETDNSEYGSISKNTLSNVPYGLSVSESGKSIYIGTDETIAIPHEDEAHYLYVFDGWNCENDSGIIDSDTTITAKFSKVPKKYEVVWKNGEKIIKTENISYGEIPGYEGDTPIKERTDKFSYTFIGWLPEICEVSENTVYEANFSESINKYIVSWFNDESLIYSEEIEYGCMPYFSEETPVKDSTAQYDYVFNGWSPQISSVEGDIEYYASYDSILREYHVVWKNEGEILYSETYFYGEEPQYTGEIPTKAETQQYVFIHSGWEPSVEPVSGDVEYNATFEQSLRKYKITFMSCERKIYETEAEYGTIPVYGGTTPKKTSTEKFAYKFIGWLPELKEVDGDAVYEAEFEEMIRAYHIVWWDENEMTAVTEMEYGRIPVYYGREPKKESTVQYDFEFAGWSPEIEPVTSDAEYHAVYREILRKYEITWMNGDEVLSVDEFYYGEIPTFSAEIHGPESDIQYDYVFAGWTPELKNTEGNFVYNAVFESVLRSYKITWICEDNILQQEDVLYGTVPVYRGEEPQKDKSDKYIYKFDGWDGEITEVDKDMTYRAIFKSFKYVVNTDEGNVEVIYNGGFDIPFDAVLRFTEVDDKNIKKGLSDYKIVTVGKIEIFSGNNAEVNLSGNEYLTVKILCPEEFKKRELKVFEYCNNELKEVNIKMEGDYLMFESLNLGTFAVAAVRSEIKNVPWWVVLVFLAVLMIVVLVIICAKKKEECMLTICYGNGNSFSVLLHEGDNIRKEIDKIGFTVSKTDVICDEFLLFVRRAKIVDIFADPNHVWRVTDRARIRRDMTVYCKIEQMRAKR